MVPEAAYVPLGVKRIIRRLFPFYAIARANDILRLRALVTISIIPYKLVTNILIWKRKKKSFSPAVEDITSVLHIYLR